ncbi:hypothetical protein K8R03_02890 [Candidatus Kaiserbacteria bacterium]|nr:hypothetical protein [Candidatus Kaiserbacteria bacterium]
MSKKMKLTYGRTSFRKRKPAKQKKRTRKAGADWLDTMPPGIIVRGVRGQGGIFQHA